MRIRLNQNKKFWIVADSATFSIPISTAQLSVAGLVTLVFSWILYVAGILAFLYLVYSGILYITSGGNPDQAKKAQLGLVSAIIGVVIIVLAYVIFRAAINLAFGLK